MSNICKKCQYFILNKKTAPFCIKCAYCNNNLHVLQIHLDGTLPLFCQVCHYQQWKKEFDSKVIHLLKISENVVC